MNKIYAVLLIASFGVAGLSACGVQGNLKSAPPMFGKERTKYEEQRAQNAQMEKKQEDSSATNPN